MNHREKRKQTHTKKEPPYLGACMLATVLRARKGFSPLVFHAPVFHESPCESCPLFRRAARNASCLNKSTRARFDGGTHTRTCVMFLFPFPMSNVFSLSVYSTYRYPGASTLDGTDRPQQTDYYWAESVLSTTRERLVVAFWLRR